MQEDLMTLQSRGNIKNSDVMKKIFFIVVIVAIFQIGLPANLYSQTGDVTKEIAARAALHYATLHSQSNYHSVVRNIPPMLHVTNYEKDTSMIERVSLVDKAFMWLVPTKDGWYLISPTQKVAPVLAYFPYSEHPTFQDMSPAALSLLGSYEDYIAECLVSNNVVVNDDIHEKWEDIGRDAASAYKVGNNYESVEPLLRKGGNIEVSWGQSGPKGFDCDRVYNKFCPVCEKCTTCNKAVVGCVAVAMAQIMWYWQWPYAAYIPTTVGGKTLDMHFYDWDKMPVMLTQSTPMENVNMVTGLLRDCGYVVDMDYGSSSSASDEDALDALRITFAYDEGMQLKKKISTSGWRNLILSELRAGRPIYYGGYNEKGEGHAFVVDGYDAATDNYYVNFGWKGADNAYVNLDVIPTTNNGKYKNAQTMIIGIQPAPLCYSRVYSPLGWVARPKFSMVHGGEITLDGVTMSNIKKSIIYSNEQIVIKGNTTISSGCDVHFAIKPIHCSGSTQNAVEVSESGTSTDDETTSVQRKTKKYIPLHDIVIDHIAIYNISGQLLQTIYGADADLSALPSGFYVLQKHMTDGSVVSETIAKH